MAVTVDADDDPRFTAELRDGGVPPVLALAGELDMAAEEQLLLAAERLWVAPCAVQVDLSGLSFVDLGGLRVLVRLRDAAASAGSSISLVGAGPRAQRVMDLVKFGSW